MALIVQKFGGTSVAGPAQLQAVARRLAKEAAAGHQVVAVLSAQGDCTDRLLNQAWALHPNPPAQLLDFLLSTGEQVSVSLCAMALEAMGCPAVALTGWQAGIQTDSKFGAACIRALDPARIRRELAAGRVVLVAGFQGVDSGGDITTLGRGGSDTTAVALAVSLQADCCQIFTDVDGVYNQDPNRNPAAKKFDTISYDRMLHLIDGGAQVLHGPCVQLAKAHALPLEVRSSFTGAPGTLVCDTPADTKA